MVTTEQQGEKRRERDAEATRRAILDAAEEVFAAHGFSGARVDAIAAASGYNKSLIFQYFDDKLGLYRAVVARMKRRVEESLGGILAPYLAGNGPPEAQQVRAFIEEAMRWSFDHYRAHSHDRRILVWETAEGWGAFNCAPLAPSGAHPSWAVDVVGFLRRAQTAGILRAEIELEVLLAHLIGVAMFYLASLPRYERLFPGLSASASADALVSAREQIVALVVHGALTPAALAATTATIPMQPASPSSTQETSHATGL